MPAPLSSILLYRTCHCSCPFQKWEKKIGVDRLSGSIQSKTTSTIKRRLTRIIIELLRLSHAITHASLLQWPAITIRRGNYRPTTTTSTPATSPRLWTATTTTTWQTVQWAWCNSTYNYESKPESNLWSNRRAERGITLIISYYYYYNY